MLRVVLLIYYYRYNTSMTGGGHGMGKPKPLDRLKYPIPPEEPPFWDYDNWYRWKLSREMGWI